MSSSGQPRIAVLLGGPSAEREVSLVSGRLCADALREDGSDVFEIDAGPDLATDLQRIKPDVVFNALHGRWGEDGCVQGLLEWLRIPYTHSGVLASALAMDKLRTKAAYRRVGLPVAADKRISKAEAKAAHPMTPPYVIKPYNEGSSVGIYIVHTDADGPAKIDDSMPDMLMAEQFVPGRELTVSVLDAGGPARATSVTDIISATGWYDYEAKYGDGGSRHVVPADLPADITALCQDYALRAHQVLGCRGLSRTDLRWDESKGAEGLFLLETNTQPGMTPTSLSPEHAAHEGISFAQLCRMLIKDASCDR